MVEINDCGYMGKILRVDLSANSVAEETVDEEILKKYIGGAGLGIKYLYEEVPPGVEWSDPGNRFMVMSGPLSGTVGGTGTYSVVTKGPMTNGAASCQANGFWGAFIKSAGYDGVIVQGKARDWVYIHISDDGVEIKNAAHILGKNTLETQGTIEMELGKDLSKLSTICIGPAGENLVRFACTNSDRGHIASHNGVGAVMGSKKLKAIAVEKGKHKVKVKDRKLLNQLVKERWEKVKVHPLNFWEGTSHILIPMAEIGALPIKNYLTHDYKEYEKLDGSYIRKHFPMKRTPCYGCPFNHCHTVTIPDGEFKGFEGEEPEYEGLAAWGPLIGNTDPAAAIVLSNEVDWLGLDTNESGWMIAWLMECYEERIFTDTNGLKMTWGNVESVRKMLRKIAYREGIGDLLAEGVMRAANKLGGEVSKRAIYTKKGNTPRQHDHRTSWNTILDTSTSCMGTDEVATLFAPPEALGLPKETDRGTAKGAALLNAAAAKLGIKNLQDSLVICNLTIFGISLDELFSILIAVTGWSRDDVGKFGLRITNLFRAFDIRHGHTADKDEPSARYGSTSLAGAGKGKSILENWDVARETYYEVMGWDRKTGKPLPETLKELGLEFVVPDPWP
jgi:aldehyde:ferredoxin oxidoreductase